MPTDKHWLDNLPDNPDSIAGTLRPAAEQQDAARYRAWRDAMINNDEAFIDRMRDILNDKDELTAAEVDAAVDHAMKGKS